jgi:light-regulated signal transduction histidine kinase (bacteriophytochrome)
VPSRRQTRRNLARAAAVVLLCSIVASVRLRERFPVVSRAACSLASHDSDRVTRLAIDTITTLRARRQRLGNLLVNSRGIEVRTEDADTLAAHDGGLVAFDCQARPTFVWLDGG